MGNVCDALYSRNILIESAKKKPAIHQVNVDPVDSFAFARQLANATSKSPAMIRIIQFILLSVSIKSIELVRWVCWMMDYLYQSGQYCAVIG